MNNQDPIGPSAISGGIYPANPTKTLPVPREMNHQDIQNAINDFKEGALRAKNAGFDGVEIHGANGYLIDSFLRSSSNIR